MRKIRAKFIHRLMNISADWRLLSSLDFIFKWKGKKYHRWGVRDEGTLHVFISFTLLFHITSFAIATATSKQIFTSFDKEADGFTFRIYSYDSCIIPVPDYSYSYYYHTFDTTRLWTIVCRTVFPSCWYLRQVGDPEQLYLVSLSRIRKALR